MHRRTKRQPASRLSTYSWRARCSSADGVRGRLHAILPNRNCRLLQRIHGGTLHLKRQLRSSAGSGSGCLAAVARTVVAHISEFLAHTVGLCAFVCTQWQYKECFILTDPYTDTWSTAEPFVGQQSGLCTPTAPGSDCAENTTHNCVPASVVCASTNVTQVTGSLGVSSAAGRKLAGTDGLVHVKHCLEHLLNLANGVDPRTVSTCISHDRTVASVLRETTWSRLVALSDLVN